MKTGKTSAATLGLVGGLALGAWIGAELTLMNTRPAVTAESAVATVQAQEEAATPRPTVPARTRRVVRASRPASREAAVAAVDAPTRGSAPRLVMTIPMSAPELHQRMKPVLARGTKLPLAVAGFTNAEQFATLAHAARNTQVPFILLKHRVLTEGRSLEAAILASKPDTDAKMEAARARTEAKSDIAALAESD